MRVWQASASVRAAAKTLGISPNAASSRASQYRSRGIPLQHFVKNVRLDIAVLKKLAMETGR